MFFGVITIYINLQVQSELSAQILSASSRRMTAGSSELNTLESLVFTLNRIFLQDHSVKRYEIPEEEPMMAAEPTIGIRQK